MRDESKRNIRVGLLTVVALAVLAVVILNVGRRQQLFTRHTRYNTSFHNVTGLQVGAPVKLNGVTVGFVERIQLPTDPTEDRITTRFTLDAAYTERIREDTRVSIKNIGLLGDKYLEIRGGSPDVERIYEGGLVPGRDQAEMEEFVAGGEDLMNNLLSISSSLKNILRRVEAGEGLIGELTTANQSREKIGDTLQTTIASIRTILDRVESGEGLIGRLLAEEENPEQLLDDLSASLRLVRQVADTFNRDLANDGSTYAALFRDPEGAALLRETITAIRDGSQAVAGAVEELASGDGTLARLMKDEDYADDFLEDLQGLVHSLHSAAEKLDRGTGTAGAFINDEQLYKDLENVVRGVNDSKVLSWFIRNRREQGEQVLEEEAEEAEEAAGTE